MPIFEALHRHLRWNSLCLAVLLAARVGVVEAHHSFAMFDDQKNVTLTGSVREFQFTNPHCFIQLLVPKPDGSGTVEWSIEMSSPPHLVRAGWTRDTVRAGDEITIVMHPLRDGHPGGSYVSATLANGHTL